MNALMEMKNINKSFGSNRVLENVNVSLYSGEVLALLGENGAGKSTLIKILGGIYKKDSGQIYVKDQLAEINNISDARTYGISIIHQERSCVLGYQSIRTVFLVDDRRGQIHRQTQGRTDGSLFPFGRAHELPVPFI